MLIAAAAALALLRAVEERCCAVQKPDSAQAAKVTSPPTPLGLRPDSTPLYPKLNEAFLLLQSGKLDQAGEGYRAALESARATNDRPAQALAHDGLGSVLYRKADYPAAKSESEQALSLYRLLQDPVSEARVTARLGSVAWNLGNIPLAREYYHKALAGFDSLNMLREKAFMLRNLEMAGEPDGGKLLEQSLAIGRQIGDKGVEADALHNLGDNFFGKGEYDAAQEKYSQAALIYRELGNQEALARVLTSEGRVQRAHGHPEKALLLYQQALELQQKVGDRQGAIQSTNALAVAYGHLNDRAKSAELYEKALAMAKETGSPLLINFELLGLSSAYLSAGKARESAEILENLVREGAQPGFHLDFVYLNLADAYTHLGRFQQAAEAVNRAIDLSRSAKNWDVFPKALLFRVDIEEKMGQKAEALADAQEALRMTEEIRMHLVPNDFMKRGFSEIAQEAYESCVRLLEHAGQPGQALEAAEDARARAFLDLLATRDLQVKAGDQAQLTSLRRSEDQQASTIDRLSATEGSSTGILVRGANSEPAAAGGSIESELRSLVSVRPFSLADVQATARRLSSTVLSYWVGEDATYIWMVSADGAIHTATVEVPEKHLAELINSLGPHLAAGKQDHAAAHFDTGGASAGEKRLRKPEQVSARGGTILSVETNHRKNWHELYRLLIEPMEAWLPSQAGSLLTIEPHGPLLMLPFAALTDKQGRYLLERFSLHYTPAVSLLQFTQKKQQEVGRIPPHYLLVADPSGMPQGPDETTLPGLPGSRHEVAAVVRLLPEKEVTLLEGSQAVEDEVAKAAARSTVIHFATHGIIRDDQPFESFLALGGSRTYKKLDGRLTAQKIYNLDLHADLVFLSACRSGAGKVSGDGLVGLTRAFWYAGTPSVIASLWDVADEPTYRLVASFYRARLQGSDKSRALRSAQLHLLHELRAGRVAVHTGTTQVALPEDPMFWASFVLQGEP
jgi:CHAT domain-containing protein/uncharacterized protein HemY